MVRARNVLILPLAALAASEPRARAQTFLTDAGTFATPGVDDARCVLVDPAGNVYVAGQANAAVGSGAGSAYVAAWSGNGTLLWSTTYDASPGGPERPSALAFDGAGGLYVAGGAATAQLGGWRAFLLRLDAAGSIVWSLERPATTGPEWSPALLVDAGGQAILGGRAPSNHGDLSIAAFSPLGALAWEATHDSGFAPPDEISHLSLAPNGDIVGAGTISVGSGPHPAVLRVTASGAIVHATTIPTATIVSGSTAGVRVDAGDRTFVASTSVSSAGGGFLPELALTALDPQGNELWTRTIPGPQQPFGGGASASDLALDPFGRVLVLGQRAQGAQGRAAVLVAFDRDGNEAWRRVVNDVQGGPATNLWHLTARLVVTGGGEAIATGLYGPALADTIGDAFVLGVDAAGSQRFGFTYGFPATPGGSFDLGSALAVAPGDGFVLVGRAQTGSSSTGFDAYYARFLRTAIPECLGDGSGTACPCGNTSAAVERAGCASSLGVGGRLTDRGASSLSADTFALVGSAMPDSSALYFQGSAALAGLSFGDGLRCAGGSTVRLGLKTNMAGGSRYPGAGDPSVSQRGLVTVPGERTYQAWYRNAAAFCTAATFNLTNGLRVTWTP